MPCQNLSAGQDSAGRLQRRDPPELGGIQRATRLPLHQVSCQRSGTPTAEDVQVLESHVIGTTYTIRQPAGMCWGFPRGAHGKEPACPCKRRGLDPWLGKSPWAEETETRSTTVNWRSPWTEEPGGQQPTGVAKETDVTEATSCTHMLGNMLL